MEKGISNEKEGVFLASKSLGRGVGIASVRENHFLARISQILSRTVLENIKLALTWEETDEDSV